MKALRGLFLANLLSIHAGQVSVNFNNFNNQSDNDLANDFASGGTFQQITSGGVTGGAVASQIQGGYATHLQAQDHPYSLRVAFYYNDPAAQLEPVARVGWAGTESVIDVSNPNVYFFAELIESDISLVRFVNQYLGTSYSGLFQATLPVNHWLALEVSATRDGPPASYRATAFLWDLGVNGQSISLIGFGSTSAQNPNMVADPAIYAGFYGNAPLFDNFEVVPEPVPFQLIGAAAVAFLLRRRR